MPPGLRRDVLIDLRCLQDREIAATRVGRHALALLGQARPLLPGHRLIGLCDPALPAMPDRVAALLDGVRGNAYTGALVRPACHVQLSPMTHDPLFTARLLHHPAIPCATVVHQLPAAPLGTEARLLHAVALRWLARYDLFLPVSEGAAEALRAVLDAEKPILVAAEDDGDSASRFWQVVAAMAALGAGSGAGPGAAPASPIGARARVALLTPLEPADLALAGPLCAALGQRVELEVFTPTAGAPCPEGARSVQRLSKLPMLSSRFDRVVSLVANTARHASIVAQVAALGGACILQDAGLLEVYHFELGVERGRRLAQAELRRGLEVEEVWHWSSGALGAGAMLLGELAAAAEPLVVHSEALGAEIARRYGGASVALKLPLTGPAGGRQEARRRLGLAEADVVIAAFDVRSTAESCIWALELLRTWGIAARLHFVGDPPRGWAALRAFAAGLGVADRIALMPARTASDHIQAADIGLLLAMRGLGSLAGTLAACAGQGLPCVASASVAQAIDTPQWIRLVPDPPSPPLLAEAIADLLAASRPTEAARQAYVAGHGTASYAARLCTALGLDG